MRGEYWRRNKEVLSEKGFTDTIERIHVDSLTTEEFIERYEKGSRPVILTGVSDSWAATMHW